MIPAAFDYRAPASIEEALQLLSRYGEEARVLAGGHGLIPALKLRQESPRVVVDLRRIQGLSAVTSSDASDDAFEVGALVTYRELEMSPLVRARCPLLAEVSGTVGDQQVRNFATPMGSVCQAHPAADIPAVLLALEAEVVIASPRGERSVPVEDFLQGSGETALEADELARALYVPGPCFPTAAYSRARLCAAGFAAAGVAAHLKLDGDVVLDADLAVTGVAGRPYRAREAEEALRGADLRGQDLGGALELLAAGREILEDANASGEYRAHLARVHARRAVMLAASRRARPGQLL